MVIESNKTLTFYLITILMVSQYWKFFNLAVLEIEAWASHMLGASSLMSEILVSDLVGSNSLHNIKDWAWLSRDYEVWISIIYVISFIRSSL